MTPFDFNTTTANSTPMFQTVPSTPVATNPLAPTLGINPVTPTVVVNTGAQPTATQTATPKPTETAPPVVTNPVADSTFKDSLNKAMSNPAPVDSSVLSSGTNQSTVLSSQDKYFQEYLANQKKYQESLLAQMTPGSEEQAIQKRLNEQRTQSALNQETALNSGETSSFAGGEAQRVGRTDAIKTAGLEAQVQTLQNSRANAVKGYESLLNSGDKSFETQLKMEQLKNTVSTIDKNANDTMNNLAQTYPDAEFIYDPTISATENLALMRDAVTNSPSFMTKSGAVSGNAPFQATINIAASNESGFGANKRITAQMEQLANSGDYKSLLLNLKQQAAKGLTAESRTELEKAEKQVLAADRMAKVLQQYSDMGGSTNFLKGKADSIATYFGKLATDPKYKEIAGELTMAFQQYRKDMTGAAFGAAESADYASVLPTKDKELDLNLALIRGAKNFTETKVDNTYFNKLGEGYTNIKALAEQKNLDTQAAQVINPLTKKPYTQQEIEEYKASRGISFNGVGNTTASITIPESSRLSFVNNNPGNLRFAGQSGAVQGEGGFAKFSNPQAGKAALENQIKLDTSRGHTLASFISKFAPPTENNTHQYLAQASSTLGVDPKTPLSKIPLDKLTKFMALKESSTKIL